MGFESREVLMRYRRRRRMSLLAGTVVAISLVAVAAVVGIFLLLRVKFL
jgi:hypothetical protein